MLTYINLISSFINVMFILDPIPIHPSTLSFPTAREQDSRPFGVEAGLHPRLHPLVAGWRIVSIPAAIPMRPSPSEGDGRTSPPPYLGHAIPSPSQRGWTGTDASILSWGDGNRSPYLMGWRSASIPASIPSFWDGGLSPSPPPSPRTPSRSTGMETGHHSPDHSLDTERDGMSLCPGGRCVIEDRPHARANTFGYFALCWW